MTIVLSYSRFYFSFLLTLVATLFLTPSLVAKPTEAPIQEQLVLGRPKSPVEIYVISDWFCSSCRKTESKIEPLYTKLKSKVTFYFVDYPVNRKSFNFVPYHLAILVNEKSKYLEARQVLWDLSAKTEDPTEEDVVAAMKKKGFQFKELPYTEVQKGTEFFEEVVQRYQVNATPTVVVVNAKTGESEKFTGRHIKDKKILATVKKWNK
jgi:protein-disulfide isomerase